MKRQLVSAVKPYQVRVVKVEFEILRVSYIEKSVLPTAIFAITHEARQNAQRGARRLHIGPQGIHAIAIREAKTSSHDKKILIVITKYGIAIGRVVKIIALEGIAYPRHVHIVEIRKIHPVGYVSVRHGPSVAPS